MLELVVRGDPDRMEGALLEDGRLVDYLAGDDGGIGDVHLARVVRVDRSLAAAMVEIGTEAPGWLALRELPREASHEGARVIVRVKRAAHDDKGPRVTTRMDETLRHAAEARSRTLEPPALLHARPPLARIVEPALEAGCERVVADDPLSALKLRKLLGRAAADATVVLEEGAWEAVEDELAAALDMHVPLPRGGALTIELTRAMTVIDVDGGPRTALEVDLDAAREIARQVRLRRLGGIIVVDFVDLGRPADRERIRAVLRSAVEPDPEPVEVLAMTRLGLVQMTRRRTGPSLDEMLRRPCPACAGSGRVRLTRKGEAER